MLPAPLRAACAGVVHGVTEWLPVSSSGHVALLIDAAGWPEGDADRRRQRRTLEVALHAGSLLPLGVEVAGIGRRAHADGAGAGLIRASVVATGVTSLIGALAGDAIERRFAGPRTVAAGLVAGSAGLLLAERTAGTRTVPDAGLRDALVLGGLQGLALVPGVSRRAATFGGARAIGFTPQAAGELSWAIGFPTLLAATVWQLRPGHGAEAGAPATGAPRGAAAKAIVGGAAAAAISGLASRPIAARSVRWPARLWAAWRLTLAGITAWRAR